MIDLSMLFLSNVHTKVEARIIVILIFDTKVKQHSTCARPNDIESFIGSEIYYFSLLLLLVLKETRISLLFIFGLKG